jgi:hypothetical protein
MAGNIKILTWVPGNNRDVAIGANAFDTPLSWSNFHNNGTYNVPAIGEIFTDNLGPTTFIGSTGRYIVLINGGISAGDVADADAIVGNITGVSVGTSVTSIGLTSESTTGGAFYNQDNLVDVSFKDDTNSGCTFIGNYAFEGCGALTYLTVPSSVTELKIGAFKASAMTSFDTVSILTIGNEVFQDCSSFTGVTFQTSLDTIGVSAFKDTAIAGNLSLNSGLTTISASAFENVAEITSITFPTSLTADIGESAFQNCDGIVNLVFAASGSNVIGTNSFQGCGSIQSIDFGGISTIGTNAFADCTSLQVVETGNNVVTIMNTAFENCTGVSKVTMGTGVLYVGEDAFGGI